jgi:hypothetical protein
MACSIPDYFGVSCFCPCFILGTIDTSIERETPILKCCSKCPLGIKGCRTCCWTTAISAVVWPISPLLMVYLSLRHKRLNMIYKNNADSITSHCAWSTFCWPMTLANMYSLIKHHEKEGSLTFRWDIDSAEDYLAPRPTHSTKRIFVIGPDSSKRHVFINKILTHCDSSNENVGQVIVSKDYDPIRIGVKPFVFKNGCVEFLELWDITPAQLECSAVVSYFPQVFSVIFLFDGSDESLDSFREMRRMYHCTAELIPVDATSLCVATNMDHTDDLFDHASKYDMLAIQQARKTLDMADSWATDNKMKLMRIGFQHNSGLKDIYRELKRLFLGDQSVQSASER